MSESHQEAVDNPEQSPFLITSEAAAYLKLKKRTLDNMRWRGDGPKFRKHGGRVCYHIDDLRDWSRSSNAP
ncbi:helix-turn-helix transcriptional regulator [Hyphococcus sp.]|uniref:helix-turn-helix transcriptional regulator n=1 Tax=Hyphococcus sp. TaxID=2038636 RepID=UPI003CCB81BC